LFDRRVQSLNQRHDGNNRGDGHDVAEHRHERPEFGRPDRREGDFGGLEKLAHFWFCLLSILTGSPSAILRTELYGPVITWSPGLRPETTSKYLSPAIPILIGTNSTFFCLSRTTNTPSTSFRVW